LSERGVEFDLLAWLQERRMALMAYCPIDGGRITGNARLKDLASSHGVSAAQVALAWLMRQSQVMAIPKAGEKAHLLDNWDSQHLKLPDAAWQELDALFPAPKRKQALAMR